MLFAHFHTRSHNALFEIFFSIRIPSELRYVWCMQCVTYLRATLVVRVTFIIIRGRLRNVFSVENAPRVRYLPAYTT